MYDYIDSLDGYDPNEDDGPVLEGFDSDDGNHHVEWMEAEIAPGLEYETWWCTTHDKLYYGGCNKVDQPYGR